jgi:hypothetical protein
LLAIDSIVNLFFIEFVKVVGFLFRSKKRFFFFEKID